MHRTTKAFRDCYNLLPDSIKDLAAKNFRLLKMDCKHPSLQFKKVSSLYSVRVGIHYRSLGLEKDGNIYWFWIGNHDEYEKIIKEL